MKLKIGVTGVRRGGGPAAVFKDHKDCELFAIADRNPDLLQNMGERLAIYPARRFADLKQLCESDVDVIFVATPAPLHAEHAIAALRAGKHVMSEVPPAFSVEEGRRLVQAVHATGRKYGLAENMCYFPHVQTYRQLIHDGELGEIIYAEGEYIHNCEHLMKDRPDGMGGGAGGEVTWRARLPPIQYCTHDLGPLLQMFGDRCVSAVGMHSGNRRRKELGVIDMEVGLFKTGKNITIKQLCGFSVAKEPPHHWFCIYGTQGQIEQSRRDEKPGYTTHYLYREKHSKLGAPMIFHVPYNEPSAPAEAVTGGHGTSEFYMVDEFVKCIFNDAKPPIDVYEALDWTLPGICAHLSAEDGSKPVAVPNPRDW